ncbi:unnamed protein product [Rotaria sordida]|uniref:Uncharacterized protein n=1 Tax=Rotaria sordida TaxID=392033 RepID=A0A815UHH6_9BILA|nr:unnamed protein product [Rotaria sordida]
MNNKQPVSLYHRFIKSYVEMHKGSRQAAYNNGNQQWNYLKRLGDDEKIEKEIDRMILESSNSFPTTLNSSPSTSDSSPLASNSSPSTSDSSPLTSNSSSSTSSSSPSDSNSSISGSSRSNKSIKSYMICPAQINLREELQETIGKISNIQALKSSNLFTIEAEKMMNKLKKQQTVCEKKLKRLEQMRLTQRKFRQNRKLKMKRLMEKHPDIAREYQLDLHVQSGQPRLEDRGQNKVIIEIASRGAAADPTRSSNLITPCITPDDLTERLKLRGFLLSRSATYLRLLSRRSHSTEGKRHVQTVPVKLISSSNDEHKKHEDQYFSTNTINHLKTLAGTFGSDAVFFLSQDDKARVPIGLPAARKQAPLLMHLEYKISIPDHDFVVALGHKLIPSVYAACVINEKQEVMRNLKLNYIKFVPFCPTLKGNGEGKKC